MEVATLGAGCFWCVEAIFQSLKGVSKVVSGYSGGHIKNPSYREVCNGTTGHAEVIQVTFDPAEISFLDILEVFWNIHDPTTLNRQGNDVGTQYRSSIFYHSEDQKETSINSKSATAKNFSSPIVTEIVPFSEFYTAEEYHQNYFNENGNQPYCSIVISPKVAKFRKTYSSKLK